MIIRPPSGPTKNGLNSKSVLTARPNYIEMRCLGTKIVGFKHGLL